MREASERRTVTDTDSYAFHIYTPGHRGIMAFYHNTDTMEKVFKWLSVTLLLVVAVATHAQQTNHHKPLLLAHAPRYNPDKISVISTYGFIYMNDIECDAPSFNETLTEYDYIVSINDIPADKFRTGEDAMVEAVSPSTADGRVNIVYHSIRGDKDYTFSFIPSNLTTYGKDETDLYASGIPSFSQRRFDYNSSKHGTHILYDKSIKDYGKYRRIAFMPTSDDPMIEKEYAEIAMKNLQAYGFPLIYDEENPDLILTIAFNEDQQVTSTYVPQTTTYIDRGSRTYVHGRKNYIYVNSFKKAPKKVTEGGYTHRDIENSHFLEVSILDAHKMQDSSQTTPPIIWQFRYKKTLNEPFPLRAAVPTLMTACRAFPGMNVFVDPTYVYNGICWADGKKSIVAHVYENSPASKLGILPGDEILKIDDQTSIQHYAQVWKNGKKQQELKMDNVFNFKKQSWYDMLNQCEMVPMSQFNSYRIPDPNQYLDYTTASFSPGIFNRNGNHIIEIKREGKKMKLEGSLYGATFFLDISNYLPK